MKTQCARFLLLACVLVPILSASAASMPRTKQLILAKRCDTLDCVRDRIDLIDQKIVLLIKDRLMYVQRAAELKKGKKSIHDQVREDKILASVSQQAGKAGYSGEIAKAVFKTILHQSNNYEKRFHHYQSQKLNTRK
ncbi:chorismate mutase [Coxiella burnetii]|uniref:chorismate mutase n=1 Tax=Coxiella burnetii TaxID=777 RepID=UPI00051F189F|nr:chorismate mutase [Coxiella burnetii]AIT64279.1 Chorismate mutase family protein [Coxiella burnetii str. Namibia]